MSIWVTLERQTSKTLRICLQCRRPGFNPWVGKIPWKRKWQPSQVFLSGEFDGQRILAGSSQVSLVAQLVKNPLAVQETPFRYLVGKIRWRRDRLPTPVSLGFPDSSADKQTTCNEGNLSLIPGLGGSPGERKGYSLQYSGLENTMDSPWGPKESDTTE